MAEAWSVMRHRKREIEDLIKILDQPHDDVETLAQDIWARVDSLRRDRECWVILVNDSGVVFTYGLYETENAARKDLEKIRAVTHKNRAMISKVLTSSTLWGGEILGYK